MKDCTCSGDHAKSVDEEIVESEDVEIVAGLDEPVEVDKEEAVLKDMEATLMKLKEEEKMMEEKKPKKKDDIDDLYKAVTTLKKHGIGVYTGQKATPAPTTEATIEEKTIDWNNLSKSWDELEDMVGGN